MKRRIIVRPEAHAELAEAAAWYRGKSEVVATGFRSAVRQTIGYIAERPGSFPEILPGVRRALTSQFPYAIFYADENGTVIVLAIKQQAQDPASWPSGA